MELKENEKQCPFCKKAIPKEAIKCPYCQTDLSTAGNVADILKAVGVILTICVTIPIILFSCGLCSLGSF
jgi:hypothetical protein